MCGMAVTRLQARVVRRPSLPLTDADERALELLRDSPAYRRALAELSGEDVADVEPSEAALLHAILVVGQRAVHDVAAEAGYAAMATDQAAQADDRRAEARRRQPSWADEA